MVEKINHDKWESASNWREVPLLKVGTSPSDSEFAPMFSQKMIELFDKLFGDKPINYYDGEDHAHDLYPPKDLCDIKSYPKWPSNYPHINHTIPQKRIHEEYETPDTYHTIYKAENLYNVVYNSCSMCVGPDYYLKLKEV